MAKDVITRFKLETTGFDSKIKKAAKELSDYSKTATQAKEGFNQFTKANIDAAKALGTTATSTTTAKERVKELVGAYNEAAKAYEALSDEHKQSDFAKALAGSLTQLQQRIRETKQEMQCLGEGMKGGGGLFSGLGDKMGGALQVFAGNIMTKAAGAVMNLGSEIADCVKQGVELAKQGEGIRNAFDRLGRGDLLDGLREATHGTVSDIELMKAAVKFNDFKLPLDELGTMLAFAQRKAQETGQSVDFMTESIVNGLGRKSLMILDNLGLSATEVKEKMKETGDMTTAVGAIIREQMAKAGDYIETAADRAAQANVSLQNKMEELGRLFAPLQESSTQLWTSMKIAILDVVSGPLARLLNGLTEAGRLKNMIDDLNGKGANGQTHTQRVLGALSHYSGDKNDLYNRQVSRYSQMESQAWREANSLRAQLNSIKNRKGKDPAGYDQTDVDNLTRRLERAENRAKAWQVIRSDYQRGAQSILNPSSGNTNRPSAVDDEKKKTRNTKATVEKTEMQINSEQIQKLTQEYIAASAERRQAIQEEIKVLQDRNKEIQNLMDEAQGKTSPTQKLTQQNIADINKSGSILGDDFMKVTSVDYKAPIEALNIQLERLIALRDKATTPEEWQRLNEEINGVQREKDDFMGKSAVDSNNTDAMADLSKGISGLTTIIGGLQKIGIQLPDEVQMLIGAIEGVMAIIQGVNTVLSVTNATAQTANTAAVTAQTASQAANTVAITSLTAALWANTATSWVPFANGGVVHAASGFRVPGNTYSMDQVPAMLNSGEVVLNRAQAGNLASQLNDGNSRGGYQPSHISGEQIYIAMNRYLKRTGRGEIVTWK